jgi:hypothetical protein
MQGPLYQQLVFACATADNEATDKRTGFAGFHQRERYFLHGVSSVAGVFQGIETAFADPACGTGGFFFALYRACNSM